MFEHFQNLFRSSRRKPKHDENAEPDANADSGGVVQNDSAPPLSPADDSQPDSISWQDPEAEELEALYRQTLNTMDQLETECRFVAEEWGEADAACEPVGRSERSREENAGNPDSEDFGHSRNPPSAPGADASGSPASNAEAAGPPVTAQQVIEAALFVGGVDLTLKRLGSLLRNEFPPETIEAFIEELNTQYREEHRPYEIRFGEGGYRLVLRSSFDDVCNRVFGLGPKEFKLSQEALEVLSLVAYEQPVSGERITELRGSNASSILRQLLRRELIALERTDEKRNTVQYRTTPRFLQAFGLASLDDLPRAEDLSFK